MFRGDVVSDTTPEVRRLVHDIDAAESRHSSLAPPPTYGHILLSGLPRVATLACQRALLLHETTRAVSATATSTAAASVSAAESDAVFVRLVLSLLSSSHTENFISPSSTTTAASGAADALPNVPVDNEADAALSMLPWTSIHMLEKSAADIAFEGQCCHEDGGVDGFPCRVALTSYPVPVLSPDTTRGLAHHWRCTRPATLNKDAGEKREEDEEKDAAAAAKCLATAMDEFHACVRVHELRSLRAVATACEELLRCLEQQQQQQASTARESPVEVRIPVPLYGVALDVDDNQTTRLEQVSHVSTPLLCAATGEESALRPLTVALQQLRAWKTKRETLQLTQSRLRRLRDYVTLSIHSQLDVVASASADGELDVSQSSAADLLLPACLVHCQLGVSRSPCVVLLFYMSVFRTQWCRAALRRTQQAAATEDTLAGDVSTVAATRIDPVAAAEAFYSLRNALVRARPRVKPNVCFAVQLLSLWRRCIAS